MQKKKQKKQKNNHVANIRDEDRARLKNGMLNSLSQGLQRILEK